MTDKEEEKMKKYTCIGVLFCFVIAACAVITVNIYFPEKDVREAYKALEKELMSPDGETEQKMDPEGKPESLFRFEIVPAAYAQDSAQADKIADIVKKMPDVVNAYKEMGDRLPDIDRLRESGKVGEGNKGFVVEREGPLTPEEKTLVELENQNRQTVMNGMAKAIIRINRVPQNDENMKQVMPQAVEQFAGVRRDSAKKGWWVQDEHGNWAKK
jgi:hypothetical protein